jgi:hypothetical protein
MMYDIFLSFKFTGVPKEELDATIPLIKNKLKEQDLSVYCSYDEEEKFAEMSYEEILEYCVERQRDSSAVLFFITNEKSSVGMDHELQEALRRKQKIIVLIQDGLSYPEFIEHARTVLRFNDSEDLLKRLSVLRKDTL